MRWSWSAALVMVGLRVRAARREAALRHQQQCAGRVAAKRLAVRNCVVSARGTGRFDAARRARRTDAIAEVDLFLTPSLIGEKNERPRYAYALLIVDGECGLVLGVQLETAEPNLQAMWGRVAARFLEIFSKHRMLPIRIAVRSPRLVQMLEPVTDELHIEVVHASSLRNLKDAKRALLQHMG